MLPVYCTYDFLEELSKSEIDLFDADSSADNKSKIELTQLFFKGVTLSIDKSMEEIINLSEKNPILKALARSPVKRLRSAPDVFNAIRHNDETIFERICPSFTQFFVPDLWMDIAVNMEKSSGYLFHTLKNPSSFQRLSLFHVEPFVYNKEKSWSFIGNLACSHHSVVIVDPYLLSQENNNHLVNLLTELYPPKIRSTYWVTLFVSNKCFQNSPNNPGEIFNRRFNWVKKELAKKIKKPIEMELVIYSREEVHDRFIITNNFMIYSGYGFNIISNTDRVKKNTSWMIVNHAKIQDSVFPGNEKPHIDTVCLYLETLRLWVKDKEPSSTTIIRNPLLT